ncbi:hypothetical protein ACFLUY_01970, partial [Chloroflexota bacterium]
GHLSVELTDPSISFLATLLPVVTSIASGVFVLRKRHLALAIWAVVSLLLAGLALLSLLPAVMWDFLELILGPT